MIEILGETKAQVPSMMIPVLSQLVYFHGLEEEGLLLLVEALDRLERGSK